jgi:DNA-binding PadR family transcriptional regulator
MNPDKIPSPREHQLLALVVTERIGRDIAKLYEKETGERIPYGTVYTVLDGMEKSGWVSSREETRGGRRIRLYKIQGAGVAAFNRSQEYFRRLAAFGSGMATEVRA